MIETIHNVETGEVTIRPYTEQEMLAVEIERAELASRFARLEAETAAKAEARAALLERLGITADEAALLLG